MRPPLYLYASIIISILLMRKYKNKKILLVVLISLCNVASLLIAMPVPMTRYAYSNILLGYLFIIWGIYEIFKKGSKNEIENEISVNEKKNQERH